MMRGQSQRAELGWALFGGAVASVALFAMTIGVGRVGDFQALRLIEAVLPTARFMASSAVAAAVTVLALLLTLLGLSLNSEFRFGARLYERAQYITILSVVAIVVGVGILLAVAVPVGEVEGLDGFYDLLYYILVLAVSVLGGIIVTIGLMIAATLFGLIGIGHPEGSSPLLIEDDDIVPDDIGR
jgi:hypothetical protein